MAVGNCDMVNVLALLTGYGAPEAEHFLCTFLRRLGVSQRIVHIACYYYNKISKSDSIYFHGWAS